MSPLFAVLLPIIRPPALLPLAIESVLAQSVTDFELLVICDGAPPETVACAEDHARRDPRVRVFAHPKGARHGEAYRHSALNMSASRYVAHIGDDDLWMPDHLAELAILLSTADFGNLLHIRVHPGDVFEALPGDLGRPETRRRMRTDRFNFFGPTCAGYRMDAYRALPEGWAPAPPDIWSDLHMWRKFLAMEDYAFATHAAVTALHFPAPDRRNVPLEQREKENRGYLERIRNPRQREEIVQAAWRSLLAAKQAEIDSMVRSRSWRLTTPLRALTARTGW
jgi:glycosyltransferase involved in cell wall biosynthesis